MTSRAAPTVVHLIDTLDTGGTQRALVALLEALDPTAFRHVVVTLREPGPTAARLPDHVACRPLHVVGRRRSAGVTLARLVRRWRARMIHARNTGCWFDATVARVLNPSVRLILGYHGMDAARPLTRCQRRKAIWGMRVGARFTSVSREGRRRLHMDARIHTDRIDVLPNGVDVARFKPAGAAARQSARRALGIHERDFVVGTVAMLTPVKGHAGLIAAVARAAERVADIRLLIVGDGPRRATLHAQARAMGIADRTVWAGHRDDVVPLLGAMDLYACSSAVEGVSNAMLEALASGLPVVTTDVGDHASVVRDGVEGRVVPHGATTALADAIVQLALDTSARTSVASAARTRAEMYSFDRTVRAYERYYKRSCRCA